ncbi:hypothetical protein ACJDU8_15645 [Clostridium sp. WILCCON 0269]|uniref:DUF2292 domain-containing protein n=1 Tax=Candidatus Clostridium eludens TaxID=3381663 RepID=A0ABW8SNQ2_9CLOT
MELKCNLNRELENKIPRIIEELIQGKDVIIKITPKGIKIQSMKISTIK